MATTEQAAHKIGFMGWDIVCRCGATFGSAQREAMQHLKSETRARKAGIVEAKLRATRWKREMTVAKRRSSLFSWLTTSELARDWGLSKRHTLRWLHAQGPLSVQVRRPTKRKNLEWRAVVR